MGLIKIAFRQ